MEESVIQFDPVYLNLQYCFHLMVNPIEMVQTKYF